MVSQFGERQQRAVVSHRYNTVRMLRTIEDILGTPHLNLNDEWARPMSDVFTNNKEPWTYTTIVPSVLCSTQLPVTCPATSTPGAIAQPLHSAAYCGEKNRGMDFSAEDRLDTERFSNVLWHAFKARALHIRLNET